MFHNINHVPHTIKYNEFIQRYWTTNALKKFCTANKLSSTGTKQALFEKIANNLLKPHEVCRHIIKNHNTKKISIKFDLAMRETLKNEIFNLYGEEVLNKFVFAVSFQKIIKTLLSKEETLTSKQMAEIWYYDYYNKANNPHIFATSEACQLNRFSAEFAQKAKLKPHNLQKAWKSTHSINRSI